MWCCRNHLWKVTQHKMYSRDVDRWKSRVKAAVKGKFHQCQAKSSSSAANMQQCRVWIGQELLWHTCGHVSCLCLCFTSPRLISSHLFFFFLKLIFRVLKRWACLLLTESSLSWCEGRALVFWVWRRNGFAGRGRERREAHLWSRKVDARKRRIQRRKKRRHRSTDLKSACWLPCTSTLSPAGDSQTSACG